MKISFSVPGVPMGKDFIMAGKIKATDEQVCDAYATTGSVWKAAKLLGMCGQSVHERLQKLGASNGRPSTYSDNDRELLKREYKAHTKAGKLSELATSMGRTSSSLCREDKKLGLTDQNIKRPYGAEVTRVNMKRWHAENAHPRGMLGKNHSGSTREKMSVSNTRAWAESSEKRRLENGKRLSLVSATNANLHNRDRTSWKAAWRTP